MNFYDSLLINLIYIISPMILYFFFASYNKDLDKEENSLILDLSLFTSLYFTIKLNSEYNILVINIPLLISYMKKSKNSAILISLFIIVYLNLTFKLNLYLLIIEYLSYFGIYCLIKKEKFFNILFVLINVLIYLSNFAFNTNINHLLFTIILFIFVTYVVIYILTRADKVMKYHMNIKELEQEKQIRMSLFKITHEIKNPLAVCKGYLDMFDVNNPEHSKKYIPIMKDEIDKTLVLLKDFLSFTKIKIEPEILDINYLLEEMVDNIMPLFKEKNIILNKKIMNDEVYINGDYNRLSQVFINILKNSVEALERKDNPRITIASILKNKIIEIIISDNGSGIDKEALVNIATPFFTTKKDGTGLGVSMSFEIIKAHKGTVEYVSTKNLGTKVIINLPIEKEL